MTRGQRLGLRLGLTPRLTHLSVASEATHGVVGVDEVTVVGKEGRGQIARHDILALAWGATVRGTYGPRYVLRARHTYSCLPQGQAALRLRYA